MRTITRSWKPLVALLFAAAVLPGCLVDMLASTAIEGELEAQSATAAMKQLDQTKRMADEIKIRQAIDVYRAEKQANPPSLEALVPEYLDAVPVDPSGEPIYAYDPATGWFGLPSEAPRTSSSGSAAMTAQDRANLDAISGALYDYHAMYGHYPQQLGELAPRFIDSIPRQAVSGQPYTYFPDTGEVYHPAELQSAVAPSRSARGSSMPLGGGSPVAEQVQAIGIMNNLDARPNPTGGRARQQVQGIATQQNEQYERTLNDLNL